MLRGLTVVEIDDAVVRLAERFVRKKVMPRPATAGDALHVAAATIHRVQYLMTWNVKHLANPNKTTQFRALCLDLGYEPPTIVTPDLLPA